MILRTHIASRPLLHGGYHCDVEVPNPLGLVHGGEQWAPESFKIGHHHHRVWEFYYQLTGSTVWDVEGEPREITADSILGVSPGTTHALHSSSSSHRFLFLAMDVSVHRIGFEPLCGQLAKRRSIVLREATKAKDPMQALLRELTSVDAYQETGLKLECERFLLALQRLAIGATGERNQPLHPAVAKSQRLIQSNPGAEWRLEELARTCGVSSGHLNQLFKRDVCRTVYDYVIECRLDEARRLLSETDLPVGEIALELGFTSSQHFSATFRNRQGITPTGFRKS